MKTFEMTGWVKLGNTEKNKSLKYKKDFVEYMKQFDWEHTKLNYDTDYLICESHDLSTEKIRKAERMGVPILTYIEALEIVEMQAIWEII